MSPQVRFSPARMTLIACLLGALAPAPPALAHDGVVIFRNGAGKLVMRLDFSDPIPIPTSVFSGINGYATGLVGFHSADLDEPLQDRFMLSTNSSIQAIFVSADPGIQIYNNLHIMHAGDAMVFYNPPFDFHPIFDIYAGNPGELFTVRLIFHDVSGIYSDSAVSTIVFTPCDSPVRITTDPTCVAQVLGENAFFYIEANGPVYTYLWRHDGADLVDDDRISGSESPGLNISTVQESDQGEYDCVVSGPCNSSTSKKATLTVFCPADYNRDGFVDPLDYNGFINAFEAGSMNADFNGDGFLDPLDYNGFINAFEAGC